MKIFYASGERPNQALPGSQVWRNNLYLALVDLGHEVVEFDYDLNPLLRHADMGAARPSRIRRGASAPSRKPRCSSRPPQRTSRDPSISSSSYFYSVCAQPSTILSDRRDGDTHDELVLQRLLPVRPRGGDRTRIRLVARPGSIQAGRLPPGRRKPDLLPGGGEPARLPPDAGSRATSMSCSSGLDTENARHTSVALLTPVFPCGRSDPAGSAPCSRGRSRRLLRAPSAAKVWVGERGRSSS